MMRPRSIPTRGRWLPAAALALLLAPACGGGGGGASPSQPAPPPPPPESVVGTWSGTARRTGVEGEAGCVTQAIRAMPRDIIETAEITLDLGEVTAVIEQREFGASCLFTGLQLGDQLDVTSDPFGDCLREAGTLLPTITCSNGDYYALAGPGALGGNPETTGWSYQGAITAGRLQGTAVYEFTPLGLSWSGPDQTGKRFIVTYRFDWGRVE